MFQAFIVASALLHAPEVFAQIKTERIDVMVDRPYYFSGQNIRIKYNLFLTNPVEKELVYSQVLNANDEVILQSKTLAINGKGEAVLEIPESIKPGDYTILVFTNYLRNYGPYGPFSSKIKILTIPTETNISKNIDPTPIILAYESGAFLTNMPNRVAFLNNHDCDVNSFQLMEDGSHELMKVEMTSVIGSFFINPRIGKKYSITHACSNSQSLKIDLPKPEETGVYLSKQIQKNKVRLLVRTNYEFNDSIRIEGYFKNLLAFKNTHFLTSKGMIIEINKSDLPQDEVMFCLIHDEKTISKLLVDLSVLDYPEISIDNDTFNISQSGNISVVFNDTIDRELMIKIIPEEWMSLEDPRYLKSRQENKEWLTDYFTLKSSCYNQNRPTPSSSKYLRETENILKGRIITESDLPDSTKLFALIPELGLTFETDINRRGEFRFPSILESFIPENLPYFIYAKDSEINNGRLVQGTTSYLNQQLQSPFTLSSSEIGKDYEAFTIKNRMEKKKLFESESTINLNIDINDFIPAADIEYELNDYTSFNTMIEVTREILNGILLRKVKKDYRLRLINDDKNTTFDGTPFIFIDNKPTKNVAEFISINPAYIEDIRIVNSNDALEKIGDLGKNGIIIINFKKRFSSNNQFASISSFPIGINTTQNNPPSLSDTTPDIRNVLLWETISSKGTNNISVDFNTSDRPGRYVVLIKSIDTRGRISFLSKPLNVVFDPVKN